MFLGSGSVSGPYPVYMSVVSSVSMGTGVGVVKWAVLEEVGGAALGSIKQTQNHKRPLSL